jgi:hypothetical protein
MEETQRHRKETETWERCRDWEKNRGIGEKTTLIDTDTVDKHSDIGEI